MPRQRWKRVRVLIRWQAKDVLNRRRRVLVVVKQQVESSEAAEHEQGTHEEPTKPAGGTVSALHTGRVGSPGRCRGVSHADEAEFPQRAVAEIAPVQAPKDDRPAVPTFNVESFPALDARVGLPIIRVITFRTLHFKARIAPLWGARAFRCSRIVHTNAFVRHIFGPAPEIVKGRNRPARNRTCAALTAFPSM